MAELNKTTLTNLYSGGASYKELMSHFQCTKSCLQHYIKKYKLQRNPINAVHHVGKKYNNITVISIESIIDSNNVFYNCRCDCGNICQIRRCNIYKTKSCHSCYIARAKKKRPERSKTKICNRCNTKFYNSVLIDGVNHNLTTRTVCAKCKPVWDYKKLKIIQKQLATKNKKLCTRCIRIKDISNFHTRTCKDCMNGFYRKRRIERKKTLINKRGGKCELCGNDNFVVLDFHHIDPKTKKFEISKAIPLKIPLQDVLEEIKKCKLLCANCHRTMHAKQIDKKYEDIELEPIISFDKASDCPFLYETAVANAEK